MSKPKPSSNIIKCECGCGKEGSRFRMQEVRCEYFERTGPELRQHTGRRFLVLPECEAPFKREMNGLMSLRILVKKFESKPWYFRLWAMDGVYQAQFYIDRRHHGYWRAIKFALRVTIVFCSPDWLAKKVSKQWARNYKQEAEDRKAIEFTYRLNDGRVTIHGKKGGTTYGVDIDLNEVTDEEHAKAVGRQLIERRFTETAETDAAPTPAPSLPSGPSPKTC